MATKIQKNQIATTLIDGWTPADATWTYASASTITVPSGAASIYQKGDRIKWTQTTVKYGVIVAVADTLLTIAPNDTYAVTNAAISANYYSHQANPLGYPGTFTYTVNCVSGWTTTIQAVWIYSIVGTTLSVVKLSAANGTSNATSVVIPLPVQSITATYGLATGYGKDNTADLTAPISGETATSQTNLTVWKGFYSNPFTTSGSKQIYNLPFQYQF